MSGGGEKMRKDLLAMLRWEVDRRKEEGAVSLEDLKVLVDLWKKLEGGGGSAGVEGPGVPQEGFGERGGGVGEDKLSKVAERLVEDVMGRLRDGG